MIITDDFVFIHFPKNGGSFFRVCLKEAYLGNPKQAFLRNMLIYLGISQKINFHKYNVDKYVPGRGVEPTFHSWCSDIPLDHADKPIVSVIRDPFDRFVSQYRYGWWKQNTSVEKKILLKNFPAFPDLSFEQFIDFILGDDNAHRTRNIANNIFHKNLNIPTDVGPYTFSFICFYFKNPDKIFEKICDNYFFSGDYKKDMYEVHFLHQEDLSMELYRYLKNTGLSKKSIRFIKRTKRINSSRTKTDSYIGYYNKKTLHQVYHKERYLFHIFQEYNDKYKQIKQTIEAD